MNRTLGNDQRQKTLFVSGRRLEVGLFALKKKGWTKERFIIHNERDATSVIFVDISNLANMAFNFDQLCLLPLDQQVP